MTDKDKPAGAGRVHLDIERVPFDKALEEERERRRLAKERDDALGFTELMAGRKPGKSRRFGRR